MEQKAGQTLRCGESLERASPELWPEQMPGVSEFARELSQLNGLTSKPHNKFRTDLDADDIRLVNELGQLTVDQLMTHVRNLQNVSYQLGVEEAKQLSRGRFLTILEKHSEKPRL